jgi:hypothetical protein
MLYVAMMTLQSSKVIVISSPQVRGNSAGWAGDTGAIRKSEECIADPFMDWIRRFSNRVIDATMGAIAVAMGAIVATMDAIAASMGAKAVANAGANHGGGASMLLYV